MISLIQKELRSLRPFAWLIVGFALLLTVYEFATGFPDENPLSAQSLLDETDGGLVVLVLGLMLGSALLVREGEDGTLSFLDGLPISRTRIFLGKVIGGLLVLLLYPLCAIAYDVLTGLLSRTSVDAPVPVKFLTIFAAAHASATLYALAIALALSFFRQWLILITGLIFWAYVWLTGAGETWHLWLNPQRLFSKLETSVSSIPWTLLGAQTGVAILALLIAWALFCRMGVRNQDSLDAARQRPLGRFALGAARLCAPIVWFIAIGTAASNSSTKDSTNRPVGEAAFARHETAHYEFLFRESQRDLAAELFDSADTVFSKIDAHLPAERKERIVVDLASPIKPHAAGQANWTKIGLPVLEGESLDNLERVLAHETAHVLAHRVGGISFLNASRWTRFFNEGLAQYLENQHYGSEEQRKVERQLVAALSVRGKVPFETLCDNDSLGGSRDEDLVYPFGEVFCRVLVQVGGADVPARILREFQKTALGNSLEGTALWRAVLQECNLNLDAVVAAYEMEIENLIQSEAEFSATIPRLTAKVEVGPETIRVVPQFSGKAPGTVVCSIEKDMVLTSKREWYSPEPDGAFLIPRKDASEKELRYLLGWKIEGFPWPRIFEPWATSPL